ncbi:N-acetyl-gamma-glutamyl-phosphate reductase [Pseudoalteromonas sp. T1lg48]|uniref:N-acetyl-gamma-glutamyl-phosphate reductase n=1 Tax=Pseudoalteromonas sp. T1lg48 TaxID=2077100 RepID=UPI000CF604B5|nr:N-acetyl-gamma-glutamyl-phosphate reductase [Pseudoalteromonas sp. T1lg48]
MNIVIIGASGYSGAELAKLVATHPHFELVGCYVSAGSADLNKPLSVLYPEHKGIVDLPLQGMDESAIATIAAQADVVCLCTDHKVSVDLAPQFLAKGLKVFDLSGGFRLADADLYEEFYGFTHQHPELLAQAVYGLAEWHSEALKTAQLVAVAGCYPTASLNALKPLQQAGLLAAEQQVIINAVSGVTGAGRKANIGTHFCEVSLAPYGLFNHRHTPEIEQYLQHPVLFTPHLGNFKRGILATIYATLNADVTLDDVSGAYQVLADEPLIRLLGANQVASIKGIENQPYVDIGWHVKGQQLIVSVAIDNLLKGASGQALQCMNLNAGLAINTGLV